jgi:alanyl-tRNA synthetase
MPLLANDIRAEFIKYFVELDHVHIPSSSLIPDNDPSLMFTNSGMVQFKDIFTGKKISQFKRATTSQKCLRAGGKHNDLENVGYTARHHTFFEMLGNFSFGDYFKEKSIEFAWMLVTKVFSLQKERLLVTVHSSDEEAAVLWKKIANLSDTRIIKIPTSDNFWSMGDTGPCGPCTEIFYDHGENIAGSPPGSENQDGDRFIEIWNIVFMQFETEQNGTRMTLPRPSIDTGMGLERITTILQGVHNNYDIDLFKCIIRDIQKISGKSESIYSTHNNVIADHIRAISFIISDGIVPSNEGRGYVLRRIIRRALRHGYALDLKEPFLYKLVESVKNAMGSHYSELITNDEMIKQVLLGEEKVFMKTIDNGMAILKSEINKLGSKDVFPADIAYKLYDTYGFPFDLTQDILKNERKKVNECDFEKIANEQRTLSKKAWTGTGDSSVDKIWYEIAQERGDTEFVRESTSLDSETIAIVKGQNIIDCTDGANECYIITKKTPFYAESGGQIGDSGHMSSVNCTIDVINTQKIIGMTIHKCVVKTGVLKVGDSVNLEIDTKRAEACAKNHTATHILHAVLRNILGKHVLQKGSLVTNEKLRFDFIHSGTVDKEQILKIEDAVLDVVEQSLEVTTKMMTMQEAKDFGAMALFGEKYPEKVRVVTVGGNFSKELCGGRHIVNTSQISSFKILSCSSIGSGIKRIEAITGQIVKSYLESTINELSEHVTSQNLIIKKLEKQFQMTKSNDLLGNLKVVSEKINNIAIRHVIVKDIQHKEILNIVDNEKKADDKRCLVIGNESSENGKISICIFISQKLLSRLDSEKIVPLIQQKLNTKTKFGGRRDLVQFGGLSLSEFMECVNSIKQFVE